MADCCVESQISIPSSPPLLFSSFIEQSSQTILNLCLFQDQVVIAQDRLAKSTLVFDGCVKFGIFYETPLVNASTTDANLAAATTTGQNLLCKMIFSKNDMSTIFVFLNSNEAHLWYMKLLELGIPQLVEVGFPTAEQLEQLNQQQVLNQLLAEEQRKVRTHSKRPSIFKYESLSLPYQGVYNQFNQSNQTTEKRFAKTSSQIQSFLYKLMLTKHLRNSPKQDALVLEQVLL